MNPSEIEAVFARTLVGEYYGDEPWAAVRELQRNGSREIFEYAAGRVASAVALERARAADVLGQLRGAYPPGEVPTQGRMFGDESTSIIAKMLEEERDTMVLSSALHALGHLHNAAAIPAILSYVDHPITDVRIAVTHALGHFPDEPSSVQALLKLTSDTDP